MDLSAQIETVLFWKSEPVTVTELSRHLEQGQEKIYQALGELNSRLNGHGIALVKTGEAVMLGTAPAAGELIAKLAKEELARDIGKAGLETLAIVLYRGRVARSEIDYIRGVNSSFILRHLLIRGLIDKISNPEDARSFLYRPTFEVLSWLGVKEITDLPDYARVVDELTISKKS